MMKTDHYSEFKSESRATFFQDQDQYTAESKVCFTGHPDHANPESNLRRKAESGVGIPSNRRAVNRNQETNNGTAIRGV